MTENPPEKPKPERIELPPNFGVQEFLNNADSSELGWIKASVVYEQWSKLRPHIDLWVGDCNRIVQIEFDPYTTTAIDRRIAKLARLREVITDFCDAATSALEEYRKAAPEHQNPEED